MKNPILTLLLPILAATLLPIPARAADGPNLLPDPSIEQTQPPNQFGIPYAAWNGNKFEGAVEFRNGKIARTGKTSAELVGAQGGKMRLFSPTVSLDPGRYRFSCYIRGLDIGTHAWGLSEDFNFVDDQYYPLKKTGTFGWTRVDMVKDVPAKQDVSARIGLWATGRLWVDDAELVKVSADTPLTNGPALGKEEAPVAPPGHLDVARAVHCPDCGYLNMPEWGHCYACGASLIGTAIAPTGPPVKPVVSFEDGKSGPFAGGTPVQEHATDGKWALRVDKDWAAWDGHQDWSGYDFFKVDVFNSSDDPQTIFIEMRDRETRDYWTRVNYNTVAPPGLSTIVMPTDIYVGEKSRPGRPLDKANIERLVLGVGDAKAPLYFDNLRLERDLSAGPKVPGLQAFDFTPGTSPPFPGFVAVTPSTVYSPGRGYGLKDAHVWRAFDALQPDPLYATFICIEGGGFAVDVPDGKYHVWLNDDSPSGFWGEYQTYRERTIKANGAVVVHDTMNLDQFKAKYFRFADIEDTPSENTFDKYQRRYFQEKEFDVDVKGGQLYLEFQGQNWANSVSALVIYPAAQAAAGQRYLTNLQERRRFYFDNYFKRVLPNPHKDAVGTVPDLTPTTAEQNAGYVLFARNWMKDVAVNAVPRRSEVTDHLQAFAAAGQLEPIVFSLYPLRDRGVVTVTASDLISPAGRVPANAIQMGLVSYRLTRVTAEGTVYTISPRFILPKARADLKKGTDTTFWLTLHTPNPVKAGQYTGKITLTFADGKTDALPLTVRLFSTPLDELDVPAGPWGSNIDLPWYGEDLGDYSRTMFRRCLAKLREYGCTTFSGIPSINISGWRDKKPVIDFATADQQMADARAAGFKDIVVNYNGGIGGFNNYFIDQDAMKAAGFDNYVDFLKSILGTVQDHARAANWLPVAYNLCDEPIGDDITRAAANAQAWRDAAPTDLLTTGATSIESPKPDDPHLPLVKALKISNLGNHDDPAIKLIQADGNNWSFYNGGNRWTYGAYMYKSAHQHDMKFRLSWHFNASAGDPFYALDSREDDYSWLVTNARQELIPAISFDREIRAGIDDYRAMLTLDRLTKAHPTSPAAIAGRKLLDDKLASFKLGDRDSNPVTRDFQNFRLQLLEAIAKLNGQAG